MSGDYTLRLGPLSFRTTSDAGPTEALGNAIEVIGAALTSADPAPKAFALTVPVGWAGRSSDALAAGQRARRQVRALLNNTQARMQGLYFAWDIDPELNGWLIVGGGDLEPGDPAGITTGEWKLSLRDCYVAGRRHMVREGVQARVADRRLASTPRDFRRLVYSTDFAAQPAAATVALSVGATDPTTFGTLPDLSAQETRDGEIAIATGLDDGQTISFERDEDYVGLGNVWIYDRRGASDPDDWEAVFGPDQPLSAGDVPVLDNGIARVRWDDDCLALDAWDGTGWEERGRVPVGVLLSATVIEWTPQRAVVAIVATDDTGQRAQTYVTLQAGWTGPMVEQYAAAAALRYVIASASAVAFRQSPGTFTTGAPLAAATMATFTAANWLSVASGGHADVLTVLRADGGSRRGSEAAVYGATRSFVELPAAGYTAARIALRAEDAAVHDPFAADTLADYTVRYGSEYLTIADGALRVVPGRELDHETHLFHNETDGFDGQITIKFTTGASLVGPYAEGRISVMLRAADHTTFLQVALDMETISIRRQVADRISSGPGASCALAPRTTYWLRAQTDGPRVTGSVWTTDPALGGAPAATATYELSGGDLATFPVGRGRAGFGLLPAGADWVYDDFVALQTTHPAASAIAASALMDVRAATVLVERT